MADQRGWETVLDRPPPQSPPGSALGPHPLVCTPRMPAELFAMLKQFGDRPPLVRGELAEVTLRRRIEPSLRGSRYRSLVTKLERNRLSIHRILSLLLLVSGGILLFLVEASHANPAVQGEGESFDVMIEIPCDDDRGSPEGGEKIETSATGCYTTQAAANTGGLNAANHLLHNATTNKYKCASCDLPEKCGKSQIVANYSAVDCTTTLQVGGNCPPGEQWYLTKCSATLIWKVSCAACL